MLTKISYMHIVTILTYIGLLWTVLCWLRVNSRW